MDYVQLECKSTQGNILCCECGIPIQPNLSNQCIGCIRSKNNITEGIQKFGTLYFCRGCERYLDPPTMWITASLESKELLRLCLKKIKGLNLVRLVDAGFSWTEPHSKRIKVKLSVQKEIQTGDVLEQEFIVEFSVQGQMCSDCHKVEAKDFWTALIQVRQKTDHKRTFYYLEQLILKHKVHAQTLGIKPAHGGLDFYFANEQGANRMLDFLTSVVPCRSTRSKKLKSHDIHSNTFNYKHTISVEIAPICKDSVVCLPRNLAHHLGGIGQICVVLRVTNNMFLIDPSTALKAELNSSTFWKMPFGVLGTSRKLVEFTVIEINDAEAANMDGRKQLSRKHQVSEVWVQRSAELGTGETIFCRTHLGNLLNHGDTVLGFDIRTSNVNDSNLDKMDSTNLPDVILVKKVYADKSVRNRKRKWKLKHLDLIEDTTSQNKDYIDFLEDLEEDPQIRTNINIYRNEDKLGLVSTTPSEIGEEIPMIHLDEMLEDLKVENPPDSPDVAEMSE